MNLNVIKTWHADKYISFIIIPLYFLVMLLLFLFRGPKPATLKNPDSAVTEVTGFAPGYYQFMLTVYDEKDAHSSATVNVSVIQSMKYFSKQFPYSRNDKLMTCMCNVVHITTSLAHKNFKNESLYR